MLWGQEDPHLYPPLTADMAHGQAPFPLLSSWTLPVQSEDPTPQWGHDHVLANGGQGQ